jgi:uncharacterized protein with HEPN domain
MSTSDDTTYLSHIRDAIETIEDYLQGVTYEALTTDKMMVDAVVRELEIIGEASGRLSREFRQKYGHILWRQIKDMRNFLIHDYLGVNTKVVWDTCKQDLPQLKSFVREVLTKQ